MATAKFFEFKFRGRAKERGMCLRRSGLAPLVLLAVAGLGGATGCGETARFTPPPTQGQVHSYYGSLKQANIDDSANKFNELFLAVGQALTGIIAGDVTKAPTGFLSISETFAPSSSNEGFGVPQNPPLLGAWAVEIPGQMALVNELKPNGPAEVASPVFFVGNQACPNFAKAVRYLYVPVPSTATTGIPPATGVVDITTQGSAVFFNVQRTGQMASTVQGGCGDTILGPLTAYPFNGVNPLNTTTDLVGISPSGVILSNPQGGIPDLLTGNQSQTAIAGAIGVIASSSPLDTNAVISAHYSGAFFAPQNTAKDPQTGNPPPYDITFLASAYGDNLPTATACSALVSSVTANLKSNGGTIPTAPSANSIYGGEFLTSTSSGLSNDPNLAASSSENCDVILDLGQQDSSNNGFFPNATMFVGSSYPPFSTANPWLCFGTTKPCAASFPAAAVVGKIQGQYVIFANANAGQLPDQFGNAVTQPVGMYLFQKQ
jgi:hypothetical protein